MSIQSCPVSGMGGGRCPAAASMTGKSGVPSRLGPRGCTFSGYSQPGDIHAAFDIPRGVDATEWLRTRERKSINEVLYSNMPMPDEFKNIKNVDSLAAAEHDILATALGAPARQVMIRAEEIGPATGWRDGYLSAEHGFCPVDYNEAPGALANTPGRVWSDLCERMPGCVARGRVRESVAGLPMVEGTEDVIPDQALWGAVVTLGLLCSIYRFEDKYDGQDGVSLNATKIQLGCEMGDDLGDELVNIPRCIALPYFQVSRRIGRALPHLSFYDQSSFNVKIKDPTSAYPYIARFDNMQLRWPMFGERGEVAFLKGCADTSASFQHGPDAIAACQEHVMNRNNEGLLREMIRLKEILERMPGAFHSISPNPNAGENYVPAQQWVRWAKFSAPLSKRCPASSGLQFPPYLVMDAFLGRKKYDSFLGAEGIHLRAWLPSNQRAFIAAIDCHYRIPEYVQQSGDARLMGVLDGIVEAYTGERGFMGAHRYKVFGILEVAAKTGRTETNGASGAADAGRPWEETHRQFAEAMKERLEPFRGDIAVEPHEMRGTFEECRYRSSIVSREFVDADPNRSIALVTLDIQNTGITWQPGDRLAVMPLNSWAECAKVAAALGLADHLDAPVELSPEWHRFSQHLGSVARTAAPMLTARDILRRGHLAPITKGLALRVHELLHASSNTVLQVLATNEWPVQGSLGDLLQGAVADTSPHIWDRAFDLDGRLAWLASLIPPEVPRTYSISNHPQELLPSTVELTVSRAEYKTCTTLAAAADSTGMCAGVSSGFLNPFVDSTDEDIESGEEVLVGVSRPVSFQLPLDRAAPCAYFAGGSGIAPFRGFWQARLASRATSAVRDVLFLGVQSREKFCYEQELREYVDAGHMEVHLAFSRDSRGLAYDRHLQDLVEKETPPRYIDALIEEQGASVCELVMSKKQGGLGGYLYVCGSVAVFDSVMSGVRRAIYNHGSATMETTDLIISKAFAERRFMLDVFMTPRPLPCNLPTIPLSELARHTGHRPGSRMWIGVHGSAYDVTDFCPMHPGGTVIIKSNAGVDCSTSFDNLAHTNNPEVSSLLTKYFVGNLSPKPDFHACDGLSDLYDLWAAYLRTTVETLVAHQFEMYEIMGASKDHTSGHDPSGTLNIWYRESLINMIGVRTFYGYQSRLLQGGFAALFGPKLQELVLKLSFTLADTAGAGTPLPDVLGIVARAKTSPEAVATSREVARIGQFVCDGGEARFAEQGILNYASRSVELDIELLEQIREEACHGMDAFDSIMDLAADTSGDQRLTALATFLMQTLERMAKRLEVFYAKLSRHSVYQPEAEDNPARARWGLVRRRVRDGSFFVLTQATVLGAAPAYVAARNQGQGLVDFDSVMHRVQASLNNNGGSNSSSGRGRGERAVPQSMNERHRARANTPPGDTSAAASHENSTALRAMTSFIDRNMRSIRRLSKMPPVPLSFAQLQEAVALKYPDTPPTSRDSSLSPPAYRLPSSSSLGPSTRQAPPASVNSIESFIAMRNMQTRATRGRSPSPAAMAGPVPVLGRQKSQQALSPRSPMTGMASMNPGPDLNMQQQQHQGMTLGSTRRAPPTPPVNAGAALAAMMGRLHTRSRAASVLSSEAERRMAMGAPSASPGGGAGPRKERSMSMRSAGSGYPTTTRLSVGSNTSLRALRLGSVGSTGDMSKPKPTF